MWAHALLFLTYVFKKKKNGEKNPKVLWSQIIFVTQPSALSNVLENWCSVKVQGTINSLAVNLRRFNRAWLPGGRDF